MLLSNDEINKMIEVQYGWIRTLLMKTCQYTFERDQAIHHLRMSLKAANASEKKSVRVGDERSR